VRTRATLRSEAVVAAIILAAFAAVSSTLIAFAGGIWLLSALVVAMITGALLRPSPPTLGRGGIRFVDRWLFDKTVPFDAIASTRTDSFMGQSWLVLLGEGGVRLGAIPITNAQLVQDLLRALGPRNTPGSLEDLARPEGATVAQWKAKLDARAHRLGDPGYRASPEAEIMTLEAAVGDASNALDVRAGAAYVLVQSGVESAVTAARRALVDAPPLAVAMARAAKGGAALVDEPALHDALGSIGGDEDLLESARGEEVEERSKAEHHK